MFKEIFKTSVLNESATAKSIMDNFPLLKMNDSDLPKEVYVFKKKDLKELIKLANEKYLFSEVYVYKIDGSYILTREGPWNLLAPTDISTGWDEITIPTLAKEFKVPYKSISLPQKKNKYDGYTANVRFLNAVEESMRDLKISADTSSSKRVGGTAFSTVSRIDNAQASFDRAKTAMRKYQSKNAVPADKF